MTTVADRPAVEDVWTWLDAVPDPEIPVVSVIDLGIIRDLRWEAAQLVVTITPTYSGCPAMQTIQDDIRNTLHDHGIEDLRLDVRLSPAWTTDWMSQRGRENLRGYGIAPPDAVGAQVIDITRITRSKTNVVPLTCPQCGSKDTTRVSQFGSTPCKSLYRCNDCLEPFDHFKPH